MLFTISHKLIVCANSPDEAAALSIANIQSGAGGSIATHVAWAGGETSLSVDTSMAVNDAAYCAASTTSPSIAQRGGALH